MSRPAPKIRVADREGVICYATLIERRGDTIIYRFDDGDDQQTTVEKLKPICECGNVLRICHAPFRPARRPAAPANGGECPSCGRIMSWREAWEQGGCNDCLTAAGGPR
jgi:hypothetical protein